MEANTLTTTMSTATIRRRRRNCESLAVLKQAPLKPASLGAARRPYGGPWWGPWWGPW